MIEVIILVASLIGGAALTLTTYWITNRSHRAEVESLRKTIKTLTDLVQVKIEKEEPKVLAKQVQEKKNESGRVSRPPASLSQLAQKEREYEKSYREGTLRRLRRSRSNGSR